MSSSLSSSPSLTEKRRSEEGFDDDDQSSSSGRGRGGNTRKGYFKDKFMKQVSLFHTNRKAPSSVVSVSAAPVRDNRQSSGKVSYCCYSMNKKKKKKKKPTLISLDLDVSNSSSTSSNNNRNSFSSQTSDPNHPAFTYELSKALIEKNDFFSTECNVHI